MVSSQLLNYSLPSCVDLDQLSLFVIRSDLNHMFGSSTLFHNKHDDDDDKVCTDGVCPKQIPRVFESVRKSSVCLINLQNTKYNRIKKTLQRTSVWCSGLQSVLKCLGGLVFILN